MKTKCVTFVALLLYIAFLPIIGQAEQHWELSGKTLYNADDIEWFSISPNGTYLLGMNEDGEFILYNTNYHSQQHLNWLVDEDSDAYDMMDYIASCAFSPYPRVETVWSADEQFFSFTDILSFEASASRTNMPALIIGNTAEQTLSIVKRWDYARKLKGEFGEVLNASFLPDSSALFYTLGQLEYSETAIANRAAVASLMRYDLNSGETTFCGTMLFTDDDGNKVSFTGRDMFALSDNLFIWSESMQQALVIARLSDSKWNYEYFLGNQEASQYCVRKIEFSAEAGIGVLLGMDNALQSVCGYIFQVNETGELTSLEKYDVPGHSLGADAAKAQYSYYDTIMNMVLSPSGNHAMLLVRRLETGKNYESNYLASLCLDSKKLTIIATLGAMNFSGTEQAQMCYNTHYGRSDIGGMNGFFWGGEYLLTPHLDQRVYQLTSDVFDMTLPSACRNQYTHSIDGASPVGNYQLTKMIDDGYDIPLSTIESYLAIIEDGTANAEFTEDGASENENWLWETDGGALILKAWEDDETPAFVVPGDQDYQRLVLINEWYEFWYDRVD